MAMYRTGTVAAPITIISNDLDIGATFNADTTPALGVLKAGTLMKYTVATQVLAKAVLGTDTIFGVLADDVDTGAAGATEVPVVMVYRDGTFLRQEIESANNTAIPVGSAIDLALADLGIVLVQSYEGYVGLSPIPAGVQPLGFEKEQEEVAKDAKEVEAKDAKEDESKRGHRR